jgi:hypothetical protein
VADRLTASLEAFVRAIVGHRLDYLAAYPAKVVAQNADGTLELQPDDVRLAGYSKVPIRYGIPGLSAQVAAGARVLLEFAGADPTKPVATVWESASVTSITHNGTTINLGGSAGLQGVGLGGNIRTELDAIWSAIFGGHVHPGVTAGGATTGAALGSPSTQTVASSVVKVKP